MPQIPGYNQQVNLIPEAPPGIQVNPLHTGYTGDAIADLGKQVQDIGVDLLDKRKKAQDTTAASDAALQLARGGADYSQQLRQTIDPTYTGYSQSIQQFYQDHYDQAMQNLPSEQAKQLFHEHASTLINHAVIQASSDETKERSQYYVADGSTQIDTSADSVLKNAGDLNNAESQLLALNQRFDNQAGNVFDRSTADTMKATAQQKLANSFMQSLNTLNTPTNPDRGAKLGIAYLNGKLGNRKTADGGTDQSEVIKGLSSSDRYKWMESFQRDVENANTVRQGDVRHDVDNEIAALAAGYKTSADPSLFQRIDQLKVSPSVRSDLKDSIQVAALAGQVKQKIATLPADQAQSVAAQFTQAVLKPGSSANFIARDRADTAVQSALAQNLKERETQSAEYVLNNYPSIQSLYTQAKSGDPNAAQRAASQMLAAQNTLGIKNQKLLSQDDASRWGALLNSRNADTASQALTQLKQTYGSYASKVIQQLSDDKNVGVDPKIQALQFISDPTAQKDMMGVINNSDYLDAKKNPITYSPTAMKQELNQQLRGVLTGVSNISSSGASQDTANAVYQMAELKAKSLLASGKASSTTEAATMAAKMLNDSLGTEGGVVYPKQITMGQKQVPMDPKVIASVQSQTTKPETLSALNVAPVDGMKAKDFYERVAPHTHWVSNRAMDGMALVYNSTAGRRYLLDANTGKNIVVHFSDLMKPGYSLTGGKSK